MFAPRSRLALALAAYVAAVLAVACLTVVMGRRHSAFLRLDPR